MTQHPHSPITSAMPPPPAPNGFQSSSNVTGTQPAVASLASTMAAAHRVLDAVEVAVIGKRPVLTVILAALLADGHVLLDDLPGVAKTLTARSFATALGLSFSRVQFTPDVLPSDITGATILDLANGQPAFRPGPIFAQLVLADEINRAPAKTQAALLEAMQERQVTNDGHSHQLPNPFLVIATQNPIESEGTYPLPEAQLDRFVLRTRIGYPTIETEADLMTQRLTRRTDDVEVRQVVTPDQFVAMQQSLELVHVDPAIVQYIALIVHATRNERELEVGASPRGSLALLKLSRAHAVLQGRDFVTPDDVRAVVIVGLTHRVVLSSESWARRIDPVDVIGRVVEQVPAPSWH
jgi:MoxR-like ATPase